MHASGVEIRLCCECDLSLSNLRPTIVYHCVSILQNAKLPFWSSVSYFFLSFFSFFLSTSLIESSSRYYLRWFSFINQKYKRPWHGLIIVIFYLTSSRITTITVLYFTSIAATVAASSHERSLFANLLFQGAFRPSEHEHSAGTTTFARVCLINVNVHRANLFVNRAALKDALLRDDR